MTTRGSTQTITATFYDSVGGPVEDPTGVSLTILYNGTTFFTAPTGDIIKDGPGLYRYEWAIPADAAVGTYVAQWQATLPGDSAPSVGYDTIEVTATATNIPQYGGCPWPVDPACLTAEWEALSAEVKARAVALASSTLRRLTAYRVGGCPITVRPVGERACCFIPAPYLDGWRGFNPGITASGAWANNCSAACSHEPDMISLPAPVGEVYEVKVDGTVINPSNYRITGNHLLWTGTGEAPWPSSQDVSLPDTQAGTFSVTYLNAYPVDSLGAYAVGVLAMEYAKACSGTKCRLPTGVTSVVRQGVAYEIASGAFPNGFTGIREVDSFIALWNPQARSQQTKVWAPGQLKFYN